MPGAFGGPAGAEGKEHRTRDRIAELRVALTSDAKPHAPDEAERVADRQRDPHSYGVPMVALNAQAASRP